MLNIVQFNNSHTKLLKWNFKVERYLFYSFFFSIEISVVVGIENLVCFASKVNVRVNVINRLCQQSIFIKVSVKKLYI